MVFSVIGIFTSKKSLRGYPKYFTFISNLPDGIGRDKNIYESKETDTLLQILQVIVLLNCPWNKSTMILFSLIKFFSHHLFEASSSDSFSPFSPISI